MKNYSRYLRILGLLAFAMPGLALGGQCSPDGGTHAFDFTFQRTFTSPEENHSQVVMPNAYAWEIGYSYPARCKCTGRVIPTNLYYTTDTDLSKGYTATVNGRSMQFYKVNRNIQVAAEVYISGSFANYTPLPLSSFDNRGTFQEPYRPCSDSGEGEVAVNLGTGRRGRLHLMIDKPFIGESVIPRTKLFDLRGTILKASPTGATPLVNVWMSGSVIVPQSCQLAPGQLTTIDFGQIRPSELAELGETPQRSVSRTFKVQCRNISESVAINLSLEGAPHPVQTDALAVNNRSDLAIILKNNGRIVPPLREFATPKPVNLIPLAFDQPTQLGEFDLEAYPVKAEKYVEPGEFKSQVTVKFEFE